MFALLLLIMLLGATNYSNSLGFALTFWLAALALVSMHHAHGNLVGLTIEDVQASPVFAGDRACFEVALAQYSRRTRRAICISSDELEPSGTVDVAAGDTATVQVAVPAPTRGPLACPRIKIDSIYPMGLFRAWSWVTPRIQTLVYPRPAGVTRLPEPDHGQRGTHTAPEQGHEDFAGHRRYTPGDSTRYIDWKASARSDDLLIREYSDPFAHTLWLDDRRLAGIPREARLSQLAQWIVVAERAGLRYGLSLAGEHYGPDMGHAHYHHCMRALALS